MSKDTSTELEVAGDVDVVPVKPGDLATLWSLDPEDPAVAALLPASNEVSARIMQDTLSAKSEEDLWKEVTTWSTKGPVGGGFEVTGFRGLYPGRYVNEDGRRGWFACFEATQLFTGEIGILTTSSSRIVGKLGWYAEHDRFPVKVEVVVRGQSGGGFDILDVDKAD